MYKNSSILHIIKIYNLLSCIRFKTLVYCVAIAYPAIAAVIILHYFHSAAFKILNINLLINISSEYNVVIYALAITSCIANCYGASKRHDWSIIWGAVLFCGCITCIFAGELISLFLSIEVMMFASCFLIYFNGLANKLRGVKYYFITHLISSNIILIAISLVIANTGDYAFITFRELILNHNTSVAIVALLITGCLINIAATPFSIWMINSYQFACNTSFIYLYSLTSKISLIILVKLFYGFAILKYAGICTIIYAVIYAYRENNFKVLLCYLSLIQTGIVLVISGTMQLDAVDEVIGYIANNMVYSVLIAILISILDDNVIDLKCSNIKYVNNRVWNFASGFAIASFVYFPLTTSFMYKCAFVDHLDILQYSVMILANIAIVIILPVKEYFASKDRIDLKLSRLEFTGLAIIVLVLIANNVIIVLERSSSPSFISNIVAQFILICICVIISFKLPIRKLPSAKASGIYVALLHRLRQIMNPTKSIAKETGFTEIATTLNSFYGKQIPLIHNQQTAIAVVFLLLTIFLTINIAQS